MYIHIYIYCELGNGYLIFGTGSRFVSTGNRITDLPESDVNTRFTKGIHLHVRDLVSTIQVAQLYILLYFYYNGFNKAGNFIRGLT